MRFRKWLAVKDETRILRVLHTLYKGVAGTRLVMDICKPEEWGLMDRK